MERSRDESDADVGYGYEIGLAIPAVGPAAAEAGDTKQDQDATQDQDDEATAAAPAPAATRVVLGSDVVGALGQGIGEQIQCLARSVSERLSQPSGAPSRQGFIVDTVDLAFGVSVQADAGEMLSVLVAPAGETNVEVTVTLKRAPELIRPPSRPVFS